MIGNGPLTVGVPLSTPVVALNVTPAGSAPVSPRVGAGVPVAVTVNVPAVPTVKVVLFALVIAGVTPDAAGDSVNIPVEKRLLLLKELVFTPER